MNYLKIYEQIITNAKSLPRKKKNGIYYEKHHIIPKCLGGTNDNENLVLLTAREHFLCHKLLHKGYPTNRQLFYAYDCMTMRVGERDIKLSSKEFQYIKEMKSKMNDKNSISENCRRRYKEVMPGRKLSEEHKRKISENSGSRGVPMTESVKKKFIEAGVLAGHTLEARQKRSATIRKKYKEERHFNARKILFGGKVYDRFGDITKELGFCNVTIHKIMDKMILENNPNYKFLE